MAIYTIVIIPLVLMLVAEANQFRNTTKTAAYADDLYVAGIIIRLRNYGKRYGNWNLNLVTFLKEANRG